jgi:hypothetical protein
MYEEAISTVQFYFTFFGVIVPVVAAVHTYGMITASAMQQASQKVKR